MFVDSDEAKGLPSLVAESGHTVWGGIFDAPPRRGRRPHRRRGGRQDGSPTGMSRPSIAAGNKHDCLTFVAKASPDGEHHPEPGHLESMIRGARHWSLPAGWVMGLEDLGEDPLFS